MGLKDLIHFRRKWLRSKLCSAFIQFSAPTCIWPVWICWVKTSTSSTSLPEVVKCCNWHTAHRCSQLYLIIFWFLGGETELILKISVHILLSWDVRISPVSVTSLSHNHSLNMSPIVLCTMVLALTAVAILVLEPEVCDCEWTVKSFIIYSLWCFSVLFYVLWRPDVVLRGAQRFKQTGLGTREGKGLEFTAERTGRDQPLVSIP